MTMSSAGNQSNIYQRPVELLQKLIRFDTSNPPGNETECINYINGLLTTAGFETTILAKAPNRPSLITRLKGRGNVPPLMLYGHVDVQITKNQTWQHPPFEGNIIDGYIWGRGALDMKSGVAMMLAALLRVRAEGLKPAGDIVLAVLCDEENLSHFGARYIVENHPGLFKDIKYAIGEFGGFTMYVGEKRFYPIQIAEKQIFFLKATVRGQGGHGSVPLRGGAMAKLGHILLQLDRNRLPVHILPVVRRMFELMASASSPPVSTVLSQLLDPAQTDQVLDFLGEQGRSFDPMFHNTFNATIVHGGENVNVIPGEITLSLDGRLLPGFGPDEGIAELRQIIGDEAEIEVLQYDPCPADTDMGLFPTLAGILQEADKEGVPIPIMLPAITDARFFSRLGIQSYGFIPMKLPQGFNFLQTIHAADERIPVEAVDFGVEAIYKLLQRFGK